MRKGKVATTVVVVAGGLAAIVFGAVEVLPPGWRVAFVLVGIALVVIGIVVKLRAIYREPSAVLVSSERAFIRGNVTDSVVARNTTDADVLVDGDAVNSEIVDNEQSRASGAEER